MSSAIIPINVDRNVTVKDYAGMRPEALLVTSSFTTFQGEGRFAGHPALFIRLAGCNIGAKLDCPWCDTRFNVDEGTVVGFGTLHEMMDRAPTVGGTRLIVFTGGEPLLQHERVLQLLSDRRADRREIFQFETNGHLLGPDVPVIEDVHYAISPKVPHTSIHHRPPTAAWRRQGGNAFLKYVVSADPESPYHTLPMGLNTCGLDVYVSGMTIYRRQLRPGEIASVWDPTLIDQQATRRNYRYAADIAVRNGYRVNLQTHLFGDYE